MNPSPDGQSFTCFIYFFCYDTKDHRNCPTNNKCLRRPKENRFTTMAAPVSQRTRCPNQLTVFHPKLNLERDRRFCLWILKDKLLLYFLSGLKPRGLIQSALTSSPASPAGPTAPSSPWRKKCHKTNKKISFLCFIQSQNASIQTSPEDQVFLLDPGSPVTLAFSVDEKHLRVNFHFVFFSHGRFHIYREALTPLRSPWVLRRHFVPEGRCHPGNPERTTVTSIFFFFFLILWFS